MKSMLIDFFLAIAFMAIIIPTIALFTKYVLVVFKFIIG